MRGHGGVVMVCGLVAGGCVGLGAGRVHQGAGHQGTEYVSHDVSSGCGMVGNQYKCADDEAWRGGEAADLARRMREQRAAAGGHSEQVDTSTIGFGFAIGIKAGLGDATVGDMSSGGIANEYFAQLLLAGPRLGFAVEGGYTGQTLKILEEEVRYAGPHLVGKVMLGLGRKVTLYGGGGVVLGHLDGVDATGLRGVGGLMYAWRIKGPFTAIPLLEGQWTSAGDPDYTAKAVVFSVLFSFFG